MTTILKTYARLWADDLDRTLPLLRSLVGRGPDLRFAFEGVELAAIGDFLVVAGPPGVRARYAHASATVVVSDLDELTRELAAHGAEVTTPEAASATGRFLYARHAGGAEVEYVEWTPGLVRQVLGRD
ncbi:VOC family protein [Nocardiopsis ansamitocini]|uniref:VOC domain-containing protein n=1 Tax=Nocardiopsis ansamitocini TaxID=1670832 RepID=A0A9W6PA38_9ACTN|nr:hypothetical protein [Nocardiopsis ansamitocini]GLU49935.1 hypothetical protein Nans01_42860 [Nocardiopsis ansamitocini]